MCVCVLCVCQCVLVEFLQLCVRVCRPVRQYLEHRELCPCLVSNQGFGSRQTDSVRRTLGPNNRHR